MRTTVTLDENLVGELLSFTHAKTKTGAVTLAVKEQIRRSKLKKLAGLLGIVDVDEKAIQGTEITTVMGDRPVATLSPFITKNHARKLGTAKGQITIKDDFKVIPEEFKDYIP